MKSKSFASKNNIPIRLGQIVRGYRNTNQAVVQFLTANKFIKQPPEDFNPDGGRYYYHPDDLAEKAKAQIIEI